ncbi:glycerol-3-phosphate dehydrogenase/oxidase [uncultured Microscilla sp.]|uniref:glycerol-3-phosphate dehydrogenase/oxidase n=1 Tax=uncultured Microscilla sp. TaxID=432653 RepID=UPI00262D28DF|nr:glycerol-3-phosphate dehydrogenase/oxidase [uncultured Microscilla sp.]
MNLLSSKNRQVLLDKLSEETYDLLLIGGGITGAGIALDAASRGLKVALIDKQDFAQGTSSRSTKLIHGGLRYLKQGEIKLVKEVGSERAIVHKNAPHLVIPEKMLLPLVQGGNYGKLMTSFGLWTYDLLAGVKGDDRRKMLSKKQTLEKEPLLNPNTLKGGGYYAEYRTDDARLTIGVIKTAAKYGALCANHCEATKLVYKREQLQGVEVTDQLTERIFTIKAQYVVNATGPWVDTIRKEDNSLKGKRLHLTKGVHLVVSHEKLPLKQSLYFDVPDGRMIFAIPRGKITYIGTTDTNYKGKMEEPRTTLADAEYLLNSINDTFPEVNLTLNDIESSWAGLRPLIHQEGKSPSELSRKDEIFESASGLISIAGGKLTGYRKMAQRVVDLVVRKMKRNDKCQTKGITIIGGEFGSAKAVNDYIAQVSQQLTTEGFEDYTAGYLVGTYGSQTKDILGKYAAQKQENPPYSPQLCLAMAELHFCLENEAVHTLGDFFNRRTGRLYFDIHSVKELVEAIAQELQIELGWTEGVLQQNRIGLQKLMEQLETFAR